MIRRKPKVDRSRSRSRAGYAKRIQEFLKSFLSELDFWRILAKIFLVIIALVIPDGVSGGNPSPQARNVSEISVRKQEPLPAKQFILVKPPMPHGVRSCPRRTRPTC